VFAYRLVRRCERLVQPEVCLFAPGKPGIRRRVRQCGWRGRWYGRRLSLYFLS
jgi:hypothetical protein